MFCSAALHRRAISWQTSSEFAPLLLAFLLAGLAARFAAAAEDLPAGGNIYQQKCAECHGANGEGVAEVTENPLHGDRELADLIRVIVETMPEDDPEECVGEDAANVARYIYKSFYTPAARAAQQPSRVELSRLTVRQYLNTTADLFATVGGGGGQVGRQVGEERGLEADYYKSRRFGRGDRVLQRVDPQVSFDYGEGAPLEEIEKAEEFSIRWEGSVLADDGGDYEFIVTSEIGVRLWVNDRETPLIDAWVSSQGRAKEHTATIRLLGGRAYPIKLDVFKYKDKTASIKLEWKPPNKARQVIGRRNLSPRGVSSTFVATAAFPPDDSVSGYERGVSVSKNWDEAATFAALELAARVAENLDRRSGRGRGRSRDRGDDNDGDGAERAREFCRQFAERAFRRPLTEPQRRFFVDAQFEGGKGFEAEDFEAEDVEAPVKRSVLLVLKSPRFLYPGYADDPGDDYAVASRLSYALWDSLPDETLLDAAAAGELRTREQVEAQARRMLENPRAKAKLRYFLHHWLQLNEKEGFAKDETLFPGFDETLVSDLRTSLDLFLDEVVWSDSSDYRQILLADYVYLNGRLAEFYGIERPQSDDVESDDFKSDEFEKVVLDPGKRAGVVTHPYLMSTLAYHNLSSPIHRGVFVTRRLLGRTLKPPPQATEFKDGEFEPGMTTREKVTVLTKPTACQSCHSVINPLGFSLEHFDAVGRFREQEQDRPIDASSDYTTVSGETKPLSAARDLAQLISESEHAHGAFVDQLFHQAAKQPINAYGPDVRQKLIDSFAASGYNIRQLLVKIAAIVALHQPDQ